ncbi:MAG: zinc ribbon domain-containing protein [Thermoproteota archaeon]
MIPEVNLLLLVIMVTSFLLVINAGLLLNQIDKTRQAVTPVKTEIVKQRKQVRTIFCTHCGMPMSSDSNFCRKCGTPLLKVDTKPPIEEVMTITCPKCGTINNANNHFCFRCGTRLEALEKPSKIKTENELPPPPPPPDIEKRLEELEEKIRSLEESLKKITESKSFENKNETSIFE